ncbi:MAG: 3-ketoacyl-ACP reductase [Oscillospiraceae bacterium]|nr:3-ketoacyl-ACP reductase [Oscillospiraceae bacterium]
MNQKTAVITGSRRGIGYAVAKQLERDGYISVYSGVSETFGEPNYIKCDVSIKEDRENLLKTVLERCGRVDVLVNNAGVAPLERLDILKTTPESFERLIKINLEGTFFMSQLFANEFVNTILNIKKSNPYSLIPNPCNPKIINISSVSAYASSVERGEYCVSKAGLSMVTKLFAHRLAEYGIGVFEVRPGVIKTDMTAPVTEKYEKLIAEGLTPTKRFGLPEDVAACVSAICTGAFDFSTGQVFNVDGGFHLRRF